MIAYFVPLNLNPDNPRHVAEIAESNNIAADDILKIRWAKPPARRSPSQICGHLIVNFSNPDTANRAKTEGLIICNKRVSVAKYKKEPIRCLKCHGWNHVASECVQTYDRCGSCGARDHRTSMCTDKSTLYCINCESHSHASWAKDCPVFVRKCKDFDNKHPENSLPYYPSTEPWTWAPNPLPPSDASMRYTPGPPPPIETRGATQRQRLRQQTLRFAAQDNMAGDPSQGTRAGGKETAQNLPQESPTSGLIIGDLNIQRTNEREPYASWYE